MMQVFLSQSSSFFAKMTSSFWSHFSILVLSCLLVFGSLYIPYLFTAKAAGSIELVTQESQVEDSTSYSSTNFINIPVDSTLVFFASYRSNTESVSFVDMTDGQNVDSLTFGCRDSYNEYVTEVWYFSGTYSESFDIQANWTDLVEDAHVGVSVYSGVDLVTPVSQSGCATDWSTEARLNVVSTSDQLVVAAVGAYSGDFNTLTPIGSGVELWNQPFGNNVVMNAASWNGDSSLQIGWDLSSSWPWVIASVTLNSAQSSPPSGGGPIVFEKAQSATSNSSDYVTMPVASIPTGSTVVALTSYRNPDGGSISYARMSGDTTLENMTFGCRDFNNEYVTEAHYFTNTQDATLNLQIGFTATVVDIHYGAVVFSGVDTTSPVSGSVCNNDWTNYAFATADSLASNVVVAAVGAYSGSNTILTPVNSGTQIWNRPNTNNMVMNAAYWQGASLLEIGWNLSVSWPWSVAGVILNEASGGPDPSPTPPADTTPPTIELITSDLIFSSSPVNITGNIYDLASDVSSLEYQIFDAQPDVPVPLNTPEPIPTSLQYPTQNYDEIALEYVTDFTHAFFDFDLILDPGAYLLHLFASDNQGNSDLGAEYSFSLGTGPSCTLENIATPTSNTQPTYTGTCTSSFGVDQVQYRFYNVSTGDVIPFTAVNSLTTGSWGDESVSFTFTANASLPDGSYIVEIMGTDGISVPSLDGSRAQDSLVVEAQDDRPPTLIFNEMLPNPTTDVTPYITGACRDTYQFETNTRVSAIEYRLNSADPGAWVSIPSFDGAYDSAIESFSIRLPELAIDSHTVEVRCMDSAGNNTDDDDTSASQTIQVRAPTLSAPEVVSFSEDFSTQLRNSIFYTDAIWGNGLVRLKEEITFDVTEIDTTGFGQRYGGVGSGLDFDVQRGEDGAIWYTKTNAFVRYDPQTSSSTEYSTLDYSSFSGVNGVKQMYAPNGDSLIWVFGSGGILLINDTADTHIKYNFNGFDSTVLSPNRVELDTRDGRVAAYIRLNTADQTQNTKLLYLDTGALFTDHTDDTIQWITSSDTFATASTGDITFDESRNMLYAANSVGLIALHDNNTPLNLADDTRSRYANQDNAALSASITDIAFDSTSHAVFFTNSLPASRTLYSAVFASANNSLDDAQINIMAQTSDLFGHSLSGLTFLEGPEYIGNQLFITNDEGSVLYYNTNSSYGDSLDDTVIDFPVAGYQYPAATKGLLVYDYNTIYTIIDRRGLIRVDLTRGWEDSNTAVGISAPQENKLYTNNISLDSLEIAARIDSQGQVAPNSQAAVNTYISLDDGFSWEAISVGEQKFIDTQDYRVRFKIDLSQNPGTTPIVDTYSLSFGAYQEPPQDPVLTARITESTAVENQPFELTILGADELGFPITSYASSVSLSLYNSLTNELTSGLSVDTANVVNGKVLLDSVSINRTGSFYIRANDGTQQANSNLITITEDPSQPEDPVPTLSFSANTYTIDQGQSATLTWNTQHITAVSISPQVGSQNTSGTAVVSPSSTTTYTLAATGNYGSLQSSLTITVRDNSEDTQTAANQTSNAVALTANDEELSAELEYSEVSIISTSPLIQKVSPRDLVRISWNVVGNPDRVYIDYLDADVSAQGSFDFIADESRKIRIDAYKDGEIVDSIVYSITVEQPEVLQKSILDMVFEAVAFIATQAREQAPLSFVVVSYGAMFMSLSHYLRTFTSSNWRKSLSILMEIPLPHKAKHWGFVYDDTSHTPVALARIVIRDTAGRIVDEAFADFKGKYRLSTHVQKELQYGFQIEAPGYTKVAKELHLAPSAVVTEDILLHKNKVPQTPATLFWTTVYPKVMGIFHVVSSLLMVWSVINGFQAFISHQSILTGGLLATHSYLLVYFVFHAIDHYRKVHFA